MSNSSYDTFPGGNLSFSLQIDQNKLNQRFKWILSMFRYFESRMKSFQDRLSLSNFQSTVSPLVFERTFEKVSKETIGKIHEERENVYKELYNGLSKDITEKFTTAVLLEQEKRLEETRTLILGSMTASAKSMERIMDDTNRTKARVNQLFKTIEEHQKTMKEKDEKPIPIFLSEVSIQTAQELNPPIQFTKNPNKLPNTLNVQLLHDVMLDKIKELSSQTYQKMKYDTMIVNRKFQSIQARLENHQYRLGGVGDDSSMDEYQRENQNSLLLSPTKSIVNRSMSPSLRKRSQIIERQTSEEIEGIRREIDMLKENQLLVSGNAAGEIKLFRDRLVLIEQRLARDIKDPSEQKWLQEKVQNHIMQMLNTPFQQKFSKKLNDSMNKRLLDMKFEIMSYMKEIERRIQQRVTRAELKNIQIETEDKIAVMKHMIDKKVNSDGEVFSKIKEVESKMTLSATQQFLRTEGKKEICLSCREPKTEFVKRRLSSSKRLPAKTLSQSFSINSYAKRFLQSKQ